MQPPMGFPAYMLMDSVDEILGKLDLTINLLDWGGLSFNPKLD